MTRFTLIFAAVLMVASTAGSLLSALPANAASQPLGACADGGNYKPIDGSSCTPTAEATSYSYYSTLSNCVSHNMGQNGSANFPIKVNENGNATTAEMFDDNQAYGYIYPGGTKTDCKNVLSKALTLWGWTGSTQKFLEAMGYTYKVDTANGTAQYVGISDPTARQKSFQKAVQAQVYGGKAPTLSGAAVYDIDYDAFTANGGTCSSKDLGLYTKLNATIKKLVDAGSPADAKDVADLPTGTIGSALYAHVTLVDTTAIASSDHVFVYLDSTSTPGRTTANTSLTSQILYGYHDDSTIVKRTCENLVKGLVANAGALKQWAIDNKGKTDPGSAKTCSDGSFPPTGGTCPVASDATTCAVDGIGWILCPVANAMAGMTDSLFDAVTAFMRVSPLSLSPTDNPLYTAWSVMRTIANIAFVIVFLIIIFSQLTSAGVSNYGVKKLLPRLVVGAILVNLSFFLCAIAVDISNVVGVSVQDLFNGISAQAAHTGTNSDDWGSITASVLSGSVAIFGGAIIIDAVASGGIWAVLAGLLPLLVGALFALFVAFLVLLARQALIIMAIVVSPLAFVAFLLPNTEGLFKKWRDLFISLLALFPMLSLVFGGSLLAAVILRETSNASLQNGDKMIGFFLYIGSFAVQAIPFFITPVLIKLSTGLLGRFAGLVNNPNKGPFDRLRKGAERVGKDVQNRGMARKLSEGKRGKASSFGARRRQRVERISAGLDNTAKYNANEYINDELAVKDANGDSILGKRMAAGDTKAGNVIAAKAVASTEAKELQEAMEPLRRALAEKTSEEKNDFLKAEVASGDISRAQAAIHYNAQIGEPGFLREQLASGNEDLVRITRQAIDANSSALMGKAPDLVKGEESAFGAVKGRELAQYKPGTVEKYMQYLEGKQTQAATADPNTDAGKKAIAEYQTAIDGFNSAIADIQADPQLQSDFSIQIGKKIQEIASSTTISPVVRQQIAASVELIQPDGKIRPKAEAQADPTVISVSHDTPAAGSPPATPQTGSGPGGLFVPGDPGFNDKPDQRR